MKLSLLFWFIDLCVYDVLIRVYLELVLVIWIGFLDIFFFVCVFLIRFEKGYVGVISYIM